MERNTTLVGSIAVEPNRFRFHCISPYPASLPAPYPQPTTNSIVLGITDDQQRCSFQNYRAPSALVASAFIAMVRLLSAGTTCVGDCDETYNYWEPLHYLLYGFGFQTWSVATLYFGILSKHQQRILLEWYSYTNLSCAV